MGERKIMLLIHTFPSSRVVRAGHDECDTKQCVIRFVADVKHNIDGFTRPEPLSLIEYVQGRLTKIRKTTKSAKIELARRGMKTTKLTTSDGEFDYHSRPGSYVYKKEMKRYAVTTKLPSWLAGMSDMIMTSLFKRGWFELRNVLTISAPVKQIQDDMQARIRATNFNFAELPPPISCLIWSYVITRPEIYDHR